MKSRSGTKQIHLYLICHRSLQEYVGLTSRSRGGMSKPHQEEWTKIVGRFRQFALYSTDHEVFDLINQVVIQRHDDPVWLDFKTKSEDYFEEWTQQAINLKLFHEFSEKEILHKVTLGAYPLHPMGAFCLPLVSQKVAQNERTLFTFLSDSGLDTLGPFLHNTSMPSDDSAPPCFTADMLWDYFGKEASRGLHDQKQIHKKWSQADSKVSPEDELEKRILKAIALLSIIDTDRARCTQETIRFCLGLRQSQSGDLREALKKLSSRQSDREKILFKNNIEGTYRFIGSTGISIEEELGKIVEERARQFSSLKALRGLISKLQLREEIPATRYNDDRMLKRALQIKFSSLDELQLPGKISGFTGENDFKDGSAVICLCEDSNEIEKAKELALNDAKHPQILMGIPKDPIRISSNLSYYDALIHLEQTQGNRYGEGADFRDEWSQLEEMYRNAIRKEVEPLVEPDSGMVTWLVDGKMHDNIRTTSKLTGLVSDMMESVFPYTPIIAHDRLTSEDGRDNFVKSRKNIIDKLLQQDGPKSLDSETSSQEKTVIEAVYRRTGILQQKRSVVVMGKPETNEAMIKIWECVDKRIKAAEEKDLRMSDIVKTLRKPPYGMKIRTIPLILAAIFRKYILRGNLSLKDKRDLPIPRIDAEAIEKAVLNPEQFMLAYTEISDSQLECLYGVAMAFEIDSPSDIDKSKLIQQTAAIIHRWWIGLPQYPRSTKLLTPRTLAVRDGIFKRTGPDSGDPHKTLLEDLPTISKEEGKHRKIKKTAWADLIGGAKNEIELAIKDHLEKNILKAVDEVFEKSGGTNKWWNSLEKERRELRSSGDPMILSQTLQAISSQKTPYEDAILKMAKDITGQALENWNDNSVENFKGRLAGAKNQIEVMEISEPTPAGGEDSQKLTPPPADRIIITINGMGYNNWSRTFVPAEKLTPTGNNLKGIMESAMDGMKGALSAGEFETILLSLLRNLE